MYNVLSSILFLTLLLCSSFLSAEEISLYDSKGEAVAYLDTDDEMTIFSWEGKPVAYLQGAIIWGFNGQHIGWFSKGVILDLGGFAVGTTKGSTKIQYKEEALKAQKLKKMPRAQKTSPLPRPSRKNEWSSVSLSDLLMSGEKLDAAVSVDEATSVDAAVDDSGGSPENGALSPVSR